MRSTDVLHGYRWQIEALVNGPILTTSVGRCGTDLDEEDAVGAKAKVQANQAPVTALLTRGRTKQWPRTDGTPPAETGPIIGIPANYGNVATWPMWSGYLATGYRYAYRSPNALPYGGTAWDNLGLWGFDEWARKNVGDPLGQFVEDIKNARRPVRLQWGTDFRGADGTTDNGMGIVTKADGSEWVELQGARILVNPLEVFAINARGMYWFTGVVDPQQRPAQLGDLVLDGGGKHGPGRPKRNAQIPASTRECMLTVERLTGEWTSPVGYVGVNPQFGTKARAGTSPYGRGYVEHRTNVTQPIVNSAWPTNRPPGDDPNSVPCGQWFLLEISDADIERWIKAVGAKGALAESKRNIARGLRSQGMVQAQTGDWQPTFLSEGTLVPTRKKLWDQAGVTNATIMGQLTDRLFEFGKLVAVEVA